MSPAGSADPPAVRRAPPDPARSHLVLLGPSGAGKSTVGPLIAARLGRPFLDLDAAIVARTGVPIATLFAEHGEGAFRGWEHRLTEELLRMGGPLIVLAPGAGWIEDPRHQALLGAAMWAVHLAVDPVVAVARMGGSVGARPMLGAGDPLESVRRLAARRESLYLQSHHTVSTDSMSPDAVASYIVALASRESGD